MQYLKTVLTWLFVIAAPLSVIFYAIFIYFKLKKDDLNKGIWKKRVKIIGYSAIVLFMLLSSVNTAITNAQNKANKANTQQIKLLTISSQRIGLPFSQVVDKLPANATIDRKIIEDEAYYSLRFDQQLLSFNNNGILIFISIDKPGIGVDDGLKVGDQESLIKDKMSTPTKQTKDDVGNLYVYDYSSYEVHFHTKNGTIDNIQMLDKPAQQPATDLVTVEGQKIFTYYTSKTGAQPTTGQ